VIEKFNYYEDPIGIILSQTSVNYNAHCMNLKEFPLTISHQFQDSGSSLLDSLFSQSLSGLCLNFRVSFVDAVSEKSTSQSKYNA